MVDRFRPLSYFLQRWRSVVLPLADIHDLTPDPSYAVFTSSDPLAIRVAYSTKTFTSHDTLSPALNPVPTLANQNVKIIIDPEPARHLSRNPLDTGHQLSSDQAYLTTLVIRI